MPNGKNGNHFNHCHPGGETKISCKRCDTKITIKLGSRNNNYTRSIDCPKCGISNQFQVDENGKVHTLRSDRGPSRKYFNQNIASI